MQTHPFDEPEPLGPLSDLELSDRIRRLSQRERELSHERRMLHAKIDLLRAELVNRLRRQYESAS